VHDGLLRRGEKVSDVIGRRIELAAALFAKVNLDILCADTSDLLEAGEDRIAVSAIEGAINMDDRLGSEETDERIYLVAQDVNRAATREGDADGSGIEFQHGGLQISETTN
jgi:hypothetical protein